MSKLVTPLLGLALATWIIGWAWWFSKNYCETTVISPETPALSISDGTFKTSSMETFAFGLSNNKPTISEGASNSLKQIAEHLKQNSDRNLSLSGLFGSFEDNPTNYENLGIGRAESIKEKLVAFGADSEQIHTEGIRIDNSVFEDNKMNGGIYFTFLGKPIEPEITEENKLLGVEDAPFEGYTIYYQTSKYLLDYDNQDMFDYLKSLKRYLRANPERKVIITGHTDNIGKRNGNEKLSEARARKVRRYLVDTGTKRSQIEINYVADDDPDATNQTREGRSKNRRVEIRVQ